jgi:LPXTG-motif cell wall-anchored protein
MKRIALLLTAVGIMLAGAGVASPASAYPFGLVSNLQALQVEGPPGYDVPAVVSNCFPNEAVTFTLGSSTASATCSSVTFEARANLAAPAQAGTHTVTAELLGTTSGGADDPDIANITRPKTLTTDIRVLAAGTNPTAPGDGGSDAGAGTGGSGSESPTAAGPTGSLPRTGSGFNGTLGLALGLVVVGLGLFAVSQLRRRSAAPSV